MGREWQVKPTPGGFRYDSDLLGLDLPAPALVGAHQIDNAATAVACIERLRAAQFRIDDAAVRKGLASVDWPARLQKLTRGPLVDALPPAGELWLDGGHNEDCGIVLARQAAEWAKEPAPLPLYLIFGMLTTKDASGFLRPLARHARAARAVPIEGHAAYTPQEACARAAEVGLDCLPANDIGAALEDLLATQPAPMRILICGSLYLAGDVLARNGCSDAQLDDRGVDPAHQLLLGLGADLGGGDLAVLEQQQGGDRADVVARRRRRVLVDVDLHHLELAIHLLGDVLQRGADHAARAAPLGPEVDQDGRVGLQDFLLEGGIGRFDGHMGSPKNTTGRSMDRRRPWVQS